MDIRRNSKSFSHRLRERVRSTLLEPGRSSGDGTTRGDGGTAPSSRAGDKNPGAPGNLFHCAQCGVVYIDAEKHVCSQCETDVEQVRSTLACNR